MGILPGRLGFRGLRFGSTKEEGERVENASSSARSCDCPFRDSVLAVDEEVTWGICCRSRDTAIGIEEGRNDMDDSRLKLAAVEAGVDGGRSSSTRSPLSEQSEGVGAELLGVTPSIGRSECVIGLDW